MQESVKAKQAWVNRIVGQGEEAPDQLLANPLNYRVHPKRQQDALAGVLNEIGWVQRVIVNKSTGHVIDGHARIGLAISRNEPTVPVLYVDLSLAEEAKVLATLDPVAAMAGADKDVLAKLLAEVSTEDAAIQALLDDLATRNGVTPPDDPEALWSGMPGFEQENKLGGSALQLIVHFSNLDDKHAFGQVIGQSIGETTKYVWHPARDREDRQGYRWSDES